MHSVAWTVVDITNEVTYAHNKPELYKYLVKFEPCYIFFEFRPEIVFLDCGSRIMLK